MIKMGYRNRAKRMAVNWFLKSIGLRKAGSSLVIYDSNTKLFPTWEGLAGKKVKLPYPCTSFLIASNG